MRLYVRGTNVRLCEGDECEAVCEGNECEAVCEGNECEAVCKRLCVRGKNVRMYIAM